MVFWGYFQFQLPYDLLNMAILAQFFQWHQISHTLNYVLDINERQDKRKKEKLKKEKEIDKAEHLALLTEATSFDYLDLSVNAKAV